MDLDTCISVIKGQLYKRILGKWSFSYKFFVKFHHDCSVQIHVKMRCVVKGLHYNILKLFEPTHKVFGTYCICGYICKSFF